MRPDSWYLYMNVPSWWRFRNTSCEFMWVWGLDWWDLEACKDAVLWKVDSVMLWLMCCFHSICMWTTEVLWLFTIFKFILNITFGIWRKTPTNYIRIHTLVNSCQYYSYHTNNAIAIDRTTANVFHLQILRPRVGGASSQRPNLPRRMPNGHTHEYNQHPHSHWRTANYEQLYHTYQ